MSLRATEDNALAREVTAELSKTWTRLREIADKPVREPLLRILTKHYPRRDLPGRCFTIQVTFFTVRDPYFDEGGLTAELLERINGKTIEGVLFDVRKTYQMRDKRRLIEAELEVTTTVRAHFGRKGFPELSHVDAISVFANDTFFGAHFQPYGGGERLGLVWYDVSCGLGPARAWTAAFRAERMTEKATKVKTSALDAELAAAFKALVERA